VCEKQFTQLTYLKRHILRHSTDSPHN